MEIALHGCGRRGRRRSTDVRGHWWSGFERNARELELGEACLEMWLPGGEGVSPGGLRLQSLEDGVHVVVHLVGASDHSASHLVKVGTKFGVHGGEEGFSCLLRTMRI